MIAIGGSTMALPDSAAQAQAGAVIRVSNAAQLKAALANYNANTTIELSPGNYGLLNVRGLHTANLTLASADPGNLAIFTGMRLSDSSGLTLQNLSLDGSENASRLPFEINASNRIALKHVTIRGPGMTTSAEALGLMVRNSDHVSIEDSLFTQWRNGLSLSVVSDVTVLRNDFYQMRSDGIRGGGWNNVTIRGNLISDFHPVEADHPDGIQIWTTNQTIVSQNVVIRENAILRGAGTPQQGIFIDDKAGKLPFRNFTIADNLILGGRTNSIYIKSADAVSITGNVAATDATYFSAFRLFDVSGSMTGNSAYRFNANPPESMTIEGNTVIEVNNAAQLQPLLVQWLAAHPDTRAAQAGRSLVTQPL